MNKQPLLPSLIGLLLLHGALARSARAVDSVVLAEDKAAKLPIVVSASAGETTRAVAAELADHLSRIGGAGFAVETGAPERGIFVGTIEEFPLPAFADALAIRDGHDGVEAFAIHPRKDSLYLVGATESGTSHAVFRFLERLGCRWFFPAPEWEILPARDRIVADFEETSRPAILSRRITPGFGFFDRKEGRCQAEIEAWRRRNRMGESLRMNNGHAWQSIIIENRAMFDAHPEYLALVKGERRKPQLCVSNPAVRRLAVDWTLDRLERRPELDMVSMETSDGLNHCECSECIALGIVSDRAFGLANEVARAVAEKYPGKLVGMLAYSDHSEPPSFDLEPNVAVQLTAGFTYGQYTFDELLERWPQITKHPGIYEYFSVWPWDHDQLPGGKANDIAMITERFRDFARRGVTSVNCESGSNWGPHGRGYYVGSRLLWDPETDVDALLADFYEKAFGPGAEPMRRFYERFDRGDRPLMSEHLLALGIRDVAEADERAKGLADVLARIDHVKQYLHYVRLRWELDHLAKADPRRRTLTLEALAWCYRTRYNYMNHWQAMWQAWTHEAAEEFDEPAWSSKQRDLPHPWADARPVTREETDHVFREDLARFQPQQIEEITFSADLAPAGKDDPGTESAGLSQRFQRPMRYAFYSRNGEALTFAITTGVIAAFRDRADGRWTVTDAAGSAIAEGRLPQDGESHRVEVDVNGPGLYWLDYADNGAGWEMETQPGTLASLALERGQRIISLGQFREPVFFFVPSGATQLQFFWEGGAMKPQLFGPDAKLVAEIDADGKFVSIDVPPGAAGKAWSFRRFAPRQFWLANAPNYLASSAATLLVPREALGGN